jgi:hypothetical protein
MRRSFASLLFLVLGLPLTLSALLLVSVRPWALDRETYKRFVEDDRLYAALQSPDMASRAPATIELQASGQKLVFDGPALTRTAQKDLPWPAIKATASRGADAFLDAALGKSPGGRIELDLRPLKLALAAKSPAAGRDYVAALTGKGSGAADASLASGTSAALVPAKASIVASGLAAAAAGIPDKVVSDPRTAARADSRRLPVGLLARNSSGLSQSLLDRITWSMVAASALLLTGLGALGGKDLYSRLARAGKYLMLPSIVVLAAGALLAIPGGFVLQNVLPPEARTMLEGQAGVQLRAYLASALGPISRDFFLTGLVAASLGGVLVSAKRIAQPKIEEED